LSKIKVLFVCKGSADGGLGHVTRTLAVADEMVHHAEVLVHVIGDSFVSKLLTGHEFVPGLSSDGADASRLAREFDPDIVFFDMLRLEEDRFSSIAKNSFLISLSPIFDRMGEVDVLFNRSAYSSYNWPTGDGAPKFRCGPEYAVINSNAVPILTAQYEQNLRHERLAVAISMGGSDAPNKTLKLLQVLRDLPTPMIFWVALGEGYAHSYEDLVDTIMASTDHEMIIAKTNKSMWRILNTCVVAVLGGGNTTYEAAYIGLPSINIMENSGHDFLVKELVDGEVCLTTEPPLDHAIEQVATGLSELTRHPDQLMKMHRNSRGFVDGLGAQRIATETLSMLGERAQSSR
jgi:spore coat polysaccharide biosynthesis predicted glycosyltransferase SpsG